MTKMTPPNSWAERKARALDENVSRDPAEGKKFIYVGCCIDFDGQSIQKMVDSEEEDWAREVSSGLEILREHCVGIDEWAETMGYVKDSNNGLILDNDWSLSYGKGIFMDLPCYWIDHSRIEYIWVDSDAARQAWKKFNFSKHYSGSGVLTAGVETGRLSCREPNLANIPRHDVTPEQRAAHLEFLKKLLISLGVDVEAYDKAGEIMKNADYAGLETRMRDQARVMGSRSDVVRDVDLLKDYNESLTPAERAGLRAQAKRFNFSMCEPTIAAKNYMAQAEAAAAGAEVMVQHEVPDPLGDPDTFKVVPLAVSANDMEKWGCPYCGYCNGAIPTAAEGTYVFYCLDCNKLCHVLVEGVKVSTVAIGGGNSGGVELKPLYPKLSKHPLEGTPKRKDRRNASE